MWRGSPASLIQTEARELGRFLGVSELLLLLTCSFFCPCICRLSERVLRPWGELRLLPSGTPVFAGSDPGRPPLRALLRPHGNPPRIYGPPPAGTPPLQRGAALLRYHVPPSGGLPQPGTRHPGAAAQQHLLRGVRPEPALYLTVAQRQRIQQPPVPPALGNERGHRVVAAPQGCLRRDESGRRTKVRLGGLGARGSGQGRGHRQA